MFLKENAFLFWTPVFTSMYFFFNFHIFIPLATGGNVTAGTTVQVFPENVRKIKVYQKQFQPIVS